MIIKQLENAYKTLKHSYIQELNFMVPDVYQSSFVHWGGGCEVQYIYTKFLKLLGKKNARCLVVGVMDARDYFMLKNSGHTVTALDIGQQPDIENIIIANVEEPLPFDPESFDVIIIGEVLEHLKLDATALENLYRVLAEEGCLIVSIPFYNDWEDGHMRIHSPISGKRLLSLAGFHVIDYLERPGLFWVRYINLIQHVVSLVWYLAFKRTAYHWLTKLVGSVEWYLGHLLFLRPIRKLTRNFGGYYLCVKGNSLDHIKLNKDLYTTKI